MIDNDVLGRRIKYFRKRAQISQFDLENEIGASAGVISRIESGKVNPTKETVREIAEYLKLDRKGIDYLIGPIAQPADEKEIQNAINAVKNHLSKKNIFGYLIDARFRAVYFSEGLKQLFAPYITGSLNEVEQRLLGKTLIEIMLDENLGLTSFFPTERSDKFWYYQLSRYYREVGFMNDDPYFQRSLKCIEKNPLTKKIWEEVKHIDINLNSLDAKIVTFVIKGKEIKLRSARDPLPEHSRFETIEYIPTNKLHKFLAKIYSAI